MGRGEQVFVSRFIAAAAGMVCILVLWELREGVLAAFPETDPSVIDGAPPAIVLGVGGGFVMLVFALGILINSQP